MNTKLRISPQIFVKIRNCPKGNTRGPRENWFMEKTWSRKSRIKLPSTSHYSKTKLKLKLHRRRVHFDSHWKREKKIFLKEEVYIIKREGDKRGRKCDCAPPPSPPSPPSPAVGWTYFISNANISCWLQGKRRNYIRQAGVYSQGCPHR